MTERVAERVDDLIVSIRHGASRDFTRHNAAMTLGYIRQIQDLGIIDAQQFEGLARAIEQAAHDWRPALDTDGLLLDS